MKIPWHIVRKTHSNWLETESELQPSLTLISNSPEKVLKKKLCTRDKPVAVANTVDRDVFSDIIFLFFYIYFTISFFYFFHFLLLYFIFLIFFHLLSFHLSFFYLLAINRSMAKQSTKKQPWLINIIIILAKFYIHKCKFTKVKPLFCVFTKKLELYFKSISASKNKKAVKSMRLCSHFNVFNLT